MKNKRFLLSNLLIVVVPTLAFSTQKPNLIIVMTDEHNFRTLSCYRNHLPIDQGAVWGKEAAEIKTPNLDRLADNGAIMMNFYSVQPVSSPSRGSFFTGLYPQLNGVVQNDLIMKDVRTIGHMLRESGYDTGYCGKLHLNGTPKPGWHPSRDFGFTDNKYMFNRGHWKVLSMDEKGEGVVVDTEDNQGARKKIDMKSFTTDFLTDRAMEYITAHKSKPFCYVLSIPDPHDPNMAREPYNSMYDNVKFEKPSTVNDKKEGYQSKWNSSAKKLAFDKPNHYFGKYFGMVKCIDDNIGRLWEHLKKEKLLDNTIVVFTADHGDMMGEHGRDQKGVPYTASAKVPMIIYYKGVIKPGMVVDNVMNSVDFIPTVLSMMGVNSKLGFNGRDCSKLIEGQKTPKDWNDMVVTKMQGWIAVATQDYKLIFTAGKKDITPVLFNLIKDPDEVHNCYGDASTKAKVKEMTKFLKNYMDKYNEPLLKDTNVTNQIEKILS